MEAESTGASGPRSAASASEKSPVETPFKYSQGISSSIDLVRRGYGGKIELLNWIRLPSSSSRRSLTRG